jgi:hypothetical protein
MASATGKRGEAACKSEDVDRSPAVCRRPVAELSEVVPAPALGTACARQGTCVEAAGDETGDATRQAVDIDRCVAIGRRPVADLTDLVIAPALGPARARERATVPAAGSDRVRTGLKPGDVDRSRTQAAAGPVVAELARTVRAPALDAACARQRAGVVAAGGDRDHPGRETGDVDRCGAVGRRPVAELSEEVPAPTLDPARVGERARMRVAGGDRDHPARKAGDVDRCVAFGRRPVSELTGAVGAPALRPTRGRDGARVIVTGGDRADAA